MAQHKYAEACPKLAESQRIAPSGGTLINLAECYEKAGQTASAWGTWKDVASRANAAGKSDVERNAITRAAALEPALAKLTISVATDSDVPGLEVKRDGVELGHAEFGLPIPVDPGAHKIEATAPKKKPFTTEIDVAPKQTDAHATVTLTNEEQAVATTTTTTSPPQTTTPGTQPTTAPSEASSGGGTLQRTLGWVGVGVGAAGLVVGGIFGLNALSKANEANNDGCKGMTCTGNNNPTLAAQGVQASKDGTNAANISTACFIAGGVLAAAGIVVVLTAPSGKSVHASPTVGRSFAGLSVTADW
jgi:hypothetical protein